MKNILDCHVSTYEGQNLHDFDNNIQLNWYPKRILELTKNANSIMELGLGHGITTNFFSNHFQKHIVLDASDAVISSFRKRYPNCNPEIIKTYFEDFESNELFDLIVLGFILEHVDDPVKVLAHTKRFLTPNGQMFVSVPNAEVLNRKLGHIAGMLPDMQLLSEHDIICGHKRYYTVDSLTADIQAAGYEVTKLEGIFLKPFTTKQLISLNFDEKIINALCTVGIDYPELCCGLLAEINPI